MLPTHSTPWSAAARKGPRQHEPPGPPRGFTRGPGRSRGRPGQQPRVATSTALMVCSRFSAWSKTTECADSKTSSVHSSRRPGHLEELTAEHRAQVVEGRQAVQELDVRVAGGPDGVHGDLVGPEQLDPLDPDLLGLPHRDPDVGVEEVRARHALGDVLGEGDPRAARRGELLRRPGPPRRARAARARRSGCPCRAGRR